MTQYLFGSFTTYHLGVPILEQSKRITVNETNYVIHSCKEHTVPTSFSVNDMLLSYFLAFVENMTIYNNMYHN